MSAMLIAAGVGGLLNYFGAEQEKQAAKKAHRQQEEFRKERNKYSSFFHTQPEMERAFKARSSIPALFSGLTQGAQFGGMIGNMYGDIPTEATPETLSPPEFSPSQYSGPEYRPQIDPYMREPIAGGYSQRRL